MTGFGYNVSGFGSFPSRGLPPYTIELVVVGAGGGGGGSGGGGGGGGTYRELTVSDVPSGLTWTATIGAGGAGNSGSYGTAGGYTQFSGTGLTTMKSMGGGRGVGSEGSGGVGGSGGGGSRYRSFNGGAAETVNGSGGTAYANAGSPWTGGSFSYWICMGGAGGGAGSAGSVGGGNHDYGSSSIGIAGWSNGAGQGKYFGPSSLGFGLAGGGSSAGFGTSQYYSLGPGDSGSYGRGIGAWYNQTSTAYGAARASPVVNQAATAASANTGSGGGAGHPHGSPGNVGASGGSGVVILRYSGEQRATGGTVTSDGGYTYHRITSSGNFIT